ncbi:MAG: hypothetical protein ACR2NJ_13190, partial [Acidimicrobiales bacterium]
MSDAAAQALFVAEFVTMLVAASGVALTATGPEVTGPARWARWALLGGFVATGAAAFVHGARLFTPDPSVELGGARMAGGAALLLGSARWAVHARGTRLLQV